MRQQKLSARSSRQGVSKRSRLIPTPEIDSRLRQICGGKGVKQGLLEYARKLKVSPSALRYRAIRLGLLTSMEKHNWTPAENQIVLKYRHSTAESIRTALKQAGYHRSLIAIYAQLRRIELIKPYYNESTLSQCFGQEKRTVERWIHMGMMKATDKGTHYHITPKDVRAFIIKYPLQVDPHTVEQVWLINILAGLYS